MPVATALVLAGGGSRRFGSDKLTQTLGGATVLDALLSGLPRDWATVVVGPERSTHRRVTWAAEDEPDGGPVAGIAAGLPHVLDDLVVVLAGDMPFAGQWAVRLAVELDARPDLEAVAAADGGERLNPLFAAYRHAALRNALPTETRHARARLLLAALTHTGLVVPDADHLDVDTQDALARARRRLGG